MDSSRSLQAVRVRRIHADTLPRPLRDEASQGSTASAEAQAGWPSEEGFMQTRCHGQSVTKLVRALHGFSGSAGRVAEREGIHADTLPQPVVKAPQLQQSASRVAEREGIHTDTLPRPLRDEASQDSTASAAAQAEWPSEKDSCRHTLPG